MHVSNMINCARARCARNTLAAVRNRSSLRCTRVLFGVQTPTPATYARARLIPATRNAHNPLRLRNRNVHSHTLNRSHAFHICFGWGECGKSATQTHNNSVSITQAHERCARTHTHRRIWTRTRALPLHNLYKSHLDRASVSTRAARRIEKSVYIRERLNID